MNYETLLILSDQAGLIVKKPLRAKVSGNSYKKYAPSWDDIEEDEPDETDLQMLEAIKQDPDCHVFINEKDITWD